ncbi:GNAT family N-acetyltransferase [Aquabacterium sp. A08]|uniref:GNAT family N-acetyltransferase n=1 Tax=Aquabacterium sp. A08 TaxID=2718532 RepID=UPI001421E373|nr:GNAT family protein [Aquabacterium sp. A08]NIC43121.1 GNAT family N-acetyltransferase [Aquabacterium sp. A08]
MTAPPWPDTVTLHGQHVRLEPLSPAHLGDLQDAVRDGELWRLWVTAVPTPEGMAAEIERRLALRAAGSMLPWAVVSLLPGPLQGRAVGMTTYMHIDAANRRVEIGSTWYRQAVQRTALNTEAKRLLLTHAFETLACIAVEFRTHALNQASRRAIERLGAQLDGVLRNHQVNRHPDAGGSLRDTCVYSITAAEWPAVRAHLQHQLARPRPLPA